MSEPFETTRESSSSSEGLSSHPSSLAPPPGNAARAQLKQALRTTPGFDAQMQMLSPAVPRSSASPAGAFAAGAPASDIPGASDRTRDPAPPSQESPPNHHLRDVNHIHKTAERSRAGGGSQFLLGGAASETGVQRHVVQREETHPQVPSSGDTVCERDEDLTPAVAAKKQPEGSALVVGSAAATEYAFDASYTPELVAQLQANPTLSVDEILVLLGQRELRVGGEQQYHHPQITQLGETHANTRECRNGHHSALLIANQNYPAPHELSTPISEAASFAGELK